MKLYAFGCSLTYGEHLDDVYPENKYPSKFAWPQILSNNLDIECVNMASPGASNKEILHTILQTDLNQEDIAVACWTLPDRFCVIKDPNYEIGVGKSREAIWAGKLLQIGPWYKKSKDSPLDEDMADAFYDYVYNEEDMLLNLHTCIDYGRLFLNSQKVTNYHFCSDPKQIKNHKWFKTTILDIDYNNMHENYKDKGYVALDGSHPHQIVHNLIANKLFKHMELTK